MPSITLSLEDTNGFVKAALITSIAKRCKEVWNLEPEIQIYDSNYKNSTTFIVVIGLPTGKYFYEYDLHHFDNMGMKFAGMKATEKPLLELYFELNLEKYLMQVSMKELEAMKNFSIVAAAAQEQQDEKQATLV